MSLCMGAYSPAVTLSISSSLRKSALTGDTLATWPSWQSASMETLITFGCEPWRGGSPESAPGWFSANCCWTKALRRLWPPVSSTQVRWIQRSRSTFSAKTQTVEAQLVLSLGRDAVRISSITSKYLNINQLFSHVTKPSEQEHRHNHL